MFPVGFAGGLKFEGPICFENGTTASWHVSWAPERYTKSKQYYLYAKLLPYSRKHSRKKALTNFAV